VKEKILEYLKNKLPEILREFEDEISIKDTVVMHAPNKEPKKFVLLGGGCGFAWVEFDGRSRKAKELFGRGGFANQAIREFKEIFINALDPKLVEYLNETGNYPGAIVSQCLNFNYYLLDEVVDFCIEEYGLKNIHVRGRLD
jgi:hypothetical protein